MIRKKEKKKVNFQRQNEANLPVKIVWIRLLAGVLLVELWQPLTSWEL